MSPKKLTTKPADKAWATGRRRGERYSGPDHVAAAELLERVDPESGRRLRTLTALKPLAHYGSGLLVEKDRVGALRDTMHLIAEARRRTGYRASE